MNRPQKLIDACEYNNICFSNLVSDLKVIIENQTIICTMLNDLINLIAENNSLLKKHIKQEGGK